MIVCTGRTATEQADAVRRGASKVLRSLHQDGLAIDLCPYEEYKAQGPDKLRWDRQAPEWVLFGEVGEALGLRWGGRFGEHPGRGDGWDPGHFELRPSVP